MCSVQSFANPFIQAEMTDYTDQINNLREKRISISSRKTYASPIAEFLLHLWDKKPNLLTDEFKTAVKCVGSIGSGASNASTFRPSTQLLRSKLPGLKTKRDGRNRWFGQ